MVVVSKTWGKSAVGPEARQPIVGESRKPVDESPKVGTEFPLPVKYKILLLSQL